jgi:dihydrofolate reductase
VDWLVGEDPASTEPGSYPAFLAGVSDIIMGYTTFHQLVTVLCPGEWPYPEQKTYVLTHRKEESGQEGAVFTDEPLESLIARLKTQEGGEIWICGGASIANQCIRLGLIDRYHFSVIPTIRGRGKRLFEAMDQPRELRLVSTEHYNGIVDLVYVPR